MGYFLGLDFNLDVSGFLEVGYKLGWVICGLSWDGLFYPKLTSLLGPFILSRFLTFVSTEYDSQFVD